MGKKSSLWGYLFCFVLTVCVCFQHWLCFCDLLLTPFVYFDKLVGGLTPTSGNPCMAVPFSSDSLQSQEEIWPWLGRAEPPSWVTASPLPRQLVGIFSQVSPRKTSSMEHSHSGSRCSGAGLNTGHGSWPPGQGEVSLWAAEVPLATWREARGGIFGNPTDIEPVPVCNPN